MNAIHFDPTQTDWNLIRSFIAVVEHGSLTRAAAQLGLSQPTLSRQIADLENVIGAPLFERVARGLKLTSVGEFLVEPARHMMSAARAVALAAASQDQALSGTVRITASEIVSAFVLPSILVDMAKKYPDIQVEIVASNQLSNLLEREADIAVRMVRPNQSALITRHIADWDLGFYAHRSYLKTVDQASPKFGSKAKDFKKLLSQYRWIGLDQSDQLIAGFRQAGIELDRHFFQFRCDNHLVNWQALQSGLGVGIATCWLAQRTPNLIRIFPEQAIPPLPVWLTSHRELKSSSKIRAVFDFLAAAIAQIKL